MVHCTNSTGINSCCRTYAYNNATQICCYCSTSYTIPLALAEISAADNDENVEKKPSDPDKELHDVAPEGDRDEPDKDKPSEPLPDKQSDVTEAPVDEKDEPDKDKPINPKKEFHDPAPKADGG